MARDKDKIFSMCAIHSSSEHETLSGEYVQNFIEYIMETYSRSSQEFRKIIFPSYRLYGFACGCRAACR